MDEQTSSHFYEFGRFRLDSRKRLLFKGDELVKLSPKAFETLLVLVEHRGKVLGKDELMKFLWPDSFVEEGNLTLNISNLRKALGENPQQHQYIVTIPGRGYQFVAGVKELSGSGTDVIVAKHTRTSSTGEEEETIAQTPAEAVAVPRQSRRFRLQLITASALLIGLAAAGYYFWMRRRASPAPPRQHLVSTFPGSHRAASFSPDGQKIAFISAVDGMPQVCVKHLAEGEPGQITFEEVPADRPRWSARGDQIVYVRQSQGTNARERLSIWSVPPEGGTPRRLIDGGRNPNWSWDGHKLVFERGYDLWTANADGSDQRRIEGVPSVDLLLADRNPAFSPDGSLIAFFQNERGMPMGDIWVIPSAGGQARRLTSDVSFGGGLAWTSDGRFIVFSSRRAGSMTLWKIPVGGGRPEPVLLGAGEDTDPEISRDGRKLIYTNTRNNFILVITDPATGQTKELLESRTDLVAPSFSPRGDRIVFFAVTGERGVHLFTIGTDGSDVTRITQGKEEHNSLPQWSADGSTIYYYQERLPASFRKISARGGESIELAPGWRWETHNGARVDPEGKRIIYSKLDKGLAAQTMIRDIETGKETAFTLPLLHPCWSSEGKFVVGVDVTSSKWPGDITICPADGGPCRKLTKGYAPQWSSDTSRIYFLRPGDLKDGGRELWSIYRAGGDERKVCDLRPDYHFINFYDVSPGGQIVWVQFRRGKNELWLSDLPNP